MSVVPNTNVDLAVHVRNILNNFGGGCTDDVRTFFQANINFMSISKPTRMAVDFTDTWQPGEHDDDWYAAIACWGIRKPHKDIPAGQWNPTPGGQGMLINSDFKSMIADQISYNSASDTHSFVGIKQWVWDKPAGGVTSPYRVGDFRMYKPNMGRYEEMNGTSPLSVTTSPLVMTGTTALSTSALIRYTLLDAPDKETSYGSMCGHLGMHKILNMDYADNKWHLCVVVYAPTKGQFAGMPTNRTAPLALLAISRSTIGEYDSVTGSNNMVSVSTSTVACVGGTALNPDGKRFYPQEKVIIFPALARERVVGGNNVWTLIGLNYKGNNGMMVDETGGNVVPGSRAKIQSVTATVTLLKVEDGSGSYILYFASNTDLTITCTSTGNEVTLRQNVQVSPGDGNTTVNAMNTGIWNGAVDEEVSGGRTFQLINSRKIYLNSVTGWSGSTPPANRPPSMRITPYSGVTQFKINVSLGYWYEKWVTIQGNATINLASSQTRYNVTFNPF